MNFMHTFSRSRYKKLRFNICISKIEMEKKRSIMIKEKKKMIKWRDQSITNSKQNSFSIAKYISKVYNSYNFQHFGVLTVLTWFLYDGNTEIGAHMLRHLFRSRAVKFFFLQKTSVSIYTRASDLINKCHVLKIHIHRYSTVF